MSDRHGIEPTVSDRRGDPSHSPFRVLCATTVSALRNLILKGEPHAGTGRPHGMPHGYDTSTAPGWPQRTRAECLAAVSAEGEAAGVEGHVRGSVYAACGLWATERVTPPRAWRMGSLVELSPPLAAVAVCSELSACVCAVPHTQRRLNVICAGDGASGKTCLLWR
jgi:hypothetical protein